MAQPASPARERIRATVPKMIDLTEKVIYGDVWERPNLSKRDRSLMVIASLVSTYRPEQLKGHIARGLDNGLTRDEIAEIITHLAFYSGWPASMTAANILKEVLEERGMLSPRVPPARRIVPRGRSGGAKHPRGPRAVATRPSPGRRQR